MAAPSLKRLPALIAALLLGAACRRAPVEAPPETPELAAPAPSSSLIATPLDAAATGYTNEMQAASLIREASALGIQQIGGHIDENAAPAPLSGAGKKERLAQLKEMRLEFARARGVLDAARDQSVALEGSTAAIISGRESGIMIGAVEDGPGVWSGSYGGAVGAGERVIEDAAAWAELWGRLSRETPPVVDFEKTRVAAVFLGLRPSSGYRARLIGIAAEPTRYLVRWFEEGPGQGAVAADSETAPFLLVSVPKDEKAVRCEKTRWVERPKNKVGL